MAVIVIIIILGVVVLFSTIATGRASVATEEAKGKSGEQYRMLAADYETLAKEARMSSQPFTTCVGASLRSRRDTRAAGAVTRSKGQPPKVVMPPKEADFRRRVGRAGIEPATLG
jgi:hypothetical protein